MPLSASPPWSVADAWSLLARETVARVELFSWQNAARTFFGFELALLQTLTNRDGVLPERASFELRVTTDRAKSATAQLAAVSAVRVSTVMLSEAPQLRAAANAGVTAIGGAGFETLVDRATRLWQVYARPLEGGDPHAPALVAGLLAHVLLAPVVPPGGGTIFGVRGVRAWLAAHGAAR